MKIITNEGEKERIEKIGREEWGERNRRDGTKVQQCSVGACIETKRGAHATVPRWHRLKRGRRRRLGNSKEGRGCEL